MRFYELFVLLITTAALLSGCDNGPKIVEVEGTVTYRGQAVPGGTITFVPISTAGHAVRPATGEIAANGVYRMRAFPGADGAQPGEYHVAVLSFRGSLIDGTAVYIVPKRFSDPKLSGLKATVPDGADGPVKLDFHLEN